VPELEHAETVAFRRMPIHACDACSRGLSAASHRRVAEAQPNTRADYFGSLTLAWLRVILGARCTTVAQTRPKPDFWWIGSLILVAISMLGFGYMLWKYYGAGR
jgi:hypothetical protein